ARPPLREPHRHGRDVAAPARLPYPARGTVDLPPGKAPGVPRLRGELRRMRGMHRRHRGAHVLVAGTGPSLERVLEETPHDLVIGVNAAPGRVACLYNVVQDHPDRFTDEKRAAALKARVLLSAAAVHAHWRLYDDLAVKWEWTRDFS